ncbi:MAG: PAS domain S-box protein [Dongiaceae bacterium]
MPEWGRILLGGIGCFLLAWADLGLAAAAGGSPLWLADGLLIFLVLDRTGGALFASFSTGAIGILLGAFSAEQAFAPLAVLIVVACGVHVALARFLLRRFAPEAARLQTARALAHLLLWGALLSSIAGALTMALPFGEEVPTPGFVSWWLASGAGTAILLPFALSLAHSAGTDLRLVVNRWREALLVVALVMLLGALARAMIGSFPLLLALPLVLWVALRLDFRSTSLLCLVLALLPMAGVALHLPPFDAGALVAATPAGEQQAYLLAIILPALFISLFAQEQRAGDRARQNALRVLQAIMDVVPLAMITSTPGGKVSLWSRGAERIFGWHRGNVEGGDPPFTSPVEAAEEAALRQRVLAGNEIQGQAVRRHDQGGVARELIVNAAPQRDADGTITGVISVMEDVTDRRRLESSREEHRAHLAAILDAVADPIITSDEEGTITSFSRAAESVFGYTAPEMIGRNLKELMAGPDRSRHDAYLRRYRETGVARMIGTSRQVTARRKDGSTFRAEITISEAWHGGRRIFAGILRDLSSKQAAADGQMQQGGPTVAKFLSRITHDLRQPLHALSLMTGALERRTEDPEARELVGHLSQIVHSIQTTFENIVEWTRLESDLVGAAVSTVPAGDIFRSLAQEFEAEAARRNLDFRCVATRAVISCDPVLVRRILRQLLDNALKFTPEGKVLIGARRRGPMLRLTVADSGVGIPADQHDFVFTAYNQLDPGREVGGLGLGLAIARRLAALVDLEIGVHSVPGRGSQFWVDVPLSG